MLSWKGGMACGYPALPGTRARSFAVTRGAPDIHSQGFRVRFRVPGGGAGEEAGGARRTPTDVRPILCWSVS
ncbi:hypothetical protein GCM10010336_61960 [Streptomyces goshikiensis]|nr:hypothetical protein GCM10010336_61960 [Streptomyces goshikiensis]